MKIHRKLKRVIVFLSSLLFSALLSYSFMQTHIEPALGAIATLRGTDGDDVLIVPNGDSNLTNYTIFGLGGDDILTGGGGQDKLFGGFGDDNLYGGLANDQLFGDLGDDSLFGGDGNDTLSADLGDDNLDGGNGDDRLSGSLNEDVLFGNDGKDNLNGGLDNDTLVGGNGQDILLGFGGGTGTTPEVDTFTGGGKVTFDNLGLVSSFDNSPDGVQDIFVLGENKDNGRVYYAQAGENDYALILDFEKGIDKFQLSPSATYTYVTASVFSARDTLVVANLSTGAELIAIVQGVDLTSK